MPAADDDIAPSGLDVIRQIEDLGPFDNVHLTLNKLGEDSDEQRLQESIQKGGGDGPSERDSAPTGTDLRDLLSQLSAPTVHALDGILQTHIAPDQRHFNLSAGHQKLFAGNQPKLHVHEFIAYFGLQTLQKRDFVTALNQLVELKPFGQVYDACLLKRDTRRATNYRKSQPKVRWHINDLTGALASFTGSAVTRADLRNGNKNSEKSKSIARRAGAQHENTHQHRRVGSGSTAGDAQQEARQRHTEQLYARGEGSIGDREKGGCDRVVNGGEVGGGEDRETSEEQERGSQHFDNSGKVGGGDDFQVNDEQERGGQDFDRVEQGGGGDDFQVTDEPDTIEVARRHHSPLASESGTGILCPHWSSSSAPGTPQSTGASPSPVCTNGFSSALSCAGTPERVSKPCNTEQILVFYSSQKGPGPTASSKMFQRISKKRSAGSPAPGEPCPLRNATMALMPGLTKGQARHIANLFGDGMLDADAIYWTMRLMNHDSEEWHIVSPHVVQPEAQGNPVTQQVYHHGGDLTRWMLVPLFFPSNSHCCLALVDLAQAEYEVYDPSHEVDNQYLALGQTAVRAFIEALSRSGNHQLGRPPDNWKATPSTIQYQCDHPGQDAGILCIMAAVDYMLEPDEQDADKSTLTRFAREAFREAFLELGSEQLTIDPMVVDERGDSAADWTKKYEELKTRLASNGLDSTLAEFVQGLTVDAKSLTALRRVEIILNNAREEQREQQREPGHRHDSERAREIQGGIDSFQSEYDRKCEFVRRAEFAAALKRFMPEQNALREKKEELRMSLWKHYSKEAQRIGALVALYAEDGP